MTQRLRERTLSPCLKLNGLALTSESSAPVSFQVGSLLEGQRASPTFLGQTRFTPLRNAPGAKTTGPISSICGN